MLLQRIFASVLLLACVGLALMAWPYQAAFPMNRWARAPFRC
jgi:putative tricarboxylic transport membrane protein